MGEIDASLHYVPTWPVPLPDMSGYTSGRVFSGTRPVSPGIKKIIARRNQEGDEGWGG